MKQCRISVVMPVYNTKEKYLSHAVKSVLDQSFEDFELIIVDDGSSDECAASCDAFENLDERIRIVHQKNLGVSAARNNGTKLAGGEYVMYVDSDDHLADYALEEAVNAIEATETDFVFAGIQHIKQYSDFLRSAARKDPSYKIYKKDEIDIVRKGFLTQNNKDFMSVCGVGLVQRGPYSRLIKMSVAKNVAFDENLVIGEDVEWNMRLLNACDSVCFVSDIWYGYLIYGNSSLSKYYGNRAELLERYHRALYKNNKRFCVKNPSDFAANMVISFYSMLRYEYLSDKCPLSNREKRLEIKKILRRKPWTLFNIHSVRYGISLRYRILIAACKLGVGLDMLKLWKKIKAKRN